MSNTLESIKRRVAVHSETGCWEWLGALTKRGYGNVRHLGRSDYAHRIVYREVNGPIPDGLEIDHLCRNRRCCNPDHLDAVTPAVNKERARRETCVRGHAMAGDNLYTSPSGHRKCLACKRLRRPLYRRADRPNYVPARPAILNEIERLNGLAR